MQCDYLSFLDDRVFMIPQHGRFGSIGLDYAPKPCVTVCIVADGKGGE